MAEAIRSFRHQHPGVVVIFGGPGKRDANPAIVPFFAQNNQTLVAFSSEFDCTQAACISAAIILHGKEEYNKAVKVFTKARTRLTCVDQVGPIVIGMGLKLELRKPKKLVKILNKTRYDDAFNAIAGFSSGLWVVRLVHPDCGLPGGG